MCIRDSLQAESHNAAEIHRRLCNVYGENVMSSVREWCRKLKGRIDVHDERGQGRQLSLIHI